MTAPQLPEGFSLRAMTFNDMAIVVESEHALFPLDAWPVEMFVAELNEKTRRYYVVQNSSNEIVAYAGLMCIPPVADVQTIAVVSEYEGKGLGTVLLRTLMDQAREQGAHEMLLEVREDNPRAQALYVRHGFEHIHTRANYYRDNIAALIMRADLLADVPGGSVTAEPQVKEQP